MRTDHTHNRNITSLHIVFSVENDDDFLSMGAAIASILKNNPLRKFIFHVFAFSIPEAQAQRISEIEKNSYARIKEHIVDCSLLYDFSELLQFPCSLKTFIRLIAPSILVEAADSALYLDVNVLCLGNIGEIASTNMNDTVALGVRCTTSGKTINKSYINTDIFFVNIRAWENYRITDETIRAHLASDKKYLFDDQIALNISLLGKADFLPSKWACIYNMSEALSLGENDLHYDRGAKFIHFSGPIKPRHDWINHEARYLFEKYHKVSAWKDTPIHRVPVNYKEVCQYCRILEKQGKHLYRFYWYTKQVLCLAIRETSGKLQLLVTKC